MSQTERAAFEDWWMLRGKTRPARSTEPGCADQYAMANAEMAWRGWKAARVPASGTERERQMSDEHLQLDAGLKVCPFCKKLPGTKVGPPAMARCVTPGCEGTKLAANLITEWNTRPHTDAGALLKPLADDVVREMHSVLQAQWDRDCLHAKVTSALLQAAFLARQTASHGSAGGEAVAWRWRQPGNKHWIYDPTPAWIEDHKHEIELEALYLGAAQAVTDCGAIRDAIVPFVTMAAAMYVSGHCGGASPEDWPSKWSISLTGGIDGHVPQQFGGMLTVADFRRLQELASALPSASRGTEA